MGEKRLMFDIPHRLYKLNIKTKGTCQPFNESCISLYDVQKNEWHRTIPKVHPLPVVA